MNLMIKKKVIILNQIFGIKHNISSKELMQKKDKILYLFKRVSNSPEIIPKIFCSNEK